MRKPKKQEKPLNDLTRSLTQFDPNHTLITGGIVPGVERQPLKKLAPDETGLLKLLERWRAEAEKAGHKIDRIAAPPFACFGQKKTLQAMSDGKYGVILSALR